jgi:hypothetical protein
VRHAINILLAGNLAHFPFLARIVRDIKGGGEDGGELGEERGDDNDEWSKGSDGDDDLHRPGRQQSHPAGLDWFNMNVLNIVNSMSYSADATHLV